MFRSSAEMARSLRTLARAGLVRPRNVGQSLTSMSEVRHWGPVVSALRHSVRMYPDSTGLIDDQGSLSFRELDQRSSALARVLYEQGVRPDAPIGVLCRDHRWLVETLLACGKLGVDVVLLNTGFAAGQLAEVVRRESVSMLVHDEEFTGILHELPRTLARLLAWSSFAPPMGPPRLADLIAAKPVGELPQPRRTGTVILLTSGTTGTPQGAKREVRSAMSAARFLDRIPLRVEGCTFIAAPMFHAIGYSQLIIGLTLSSTIVVHRRFNAAELVRSVHTHQCSAIVLVPTMLQRIVELHPSFVAQCLESVNVILVSGSPLTSALFQRTRDVLGDVLYNLYGSTEVAVATVATPDELRMAPDTVGRSPHSCVVALFDGANQRITTPHTTGRIFSGSDLGFIGYTGLDHRDRIGELISTGDLGHFDERGLLFIDGREDDMIVSGGENVFPGEVENFLATHYQVKDVAVVGVPDREFGQRLRAYVALVQGATVTADQLKEFVRMSLARHKVPREVVLVNAVPRNATGKIVRRALAGPRG